MTGVRLPVLPASMPDLAVDPAAIADGGVDLLAASAQIDDLGTFVAGPARLDDWTGEASLVYHAELRPIGRVADAMSLALRGVARRVDAHSTAMAELLEQRADLSRVQRLLADGVQVLRDDVSRATPDRYGVLQARADGVADSIAGYERDRLAWMARLAAEERAMVAAFERVLTLQQVEDRYGGATDPADGALSARPPPGSSPEEVHRWWTGLTRRQRLAIMAAAPGAIGNLDGVPAGARHRANTVALRRDLAEWRSLEHQGVLTDDERRALANAEAAEEALRRVGRRVDPVTGDPLPAQLHSYDPRAFDGDGSVAVAVGDLDTAGDVAVVVPGFGTDATSIDYLVDRGANVYEAARTLDHDADATTATLVWVGYDAPDDLPGKDGFGGDAVGVVTEGMAERGGDRLADALDGLRAARDGDPAHLTVIGHSYGSTTVGHAAHDHETDIDDVVFVGSPGVGGGTHHAGDLGVDPGHVWAGANSRDPVADLGNHGWVNLGTVAGVGLGDDPAEDDFGATRFRAESTTRGAGPNPLADHSKYFDHGTESLENIGHVVTGDYDEVSEAGPVTDPWWGSPRDPESDREPSAPQTSRQP